MPPGWSVERFAALGAPGVRVLANDCPVIVEVGDGPPERIEAAVVLVCGDYCLVRDSSEPEWYMGRLGTDGAVTCWASYGDDLEAAIRAL